MIELLDELLLPSGETVRVSCLTPPEPEYAERMRVFLRHKDDENTRSINSRVAGKYAEVSVDRYFIAEIGGRVAAQVWYGYGRHEDAVANFGHVYTDPDFRRRGLIHLLMPYLRRDFDASPALGAFCTAGAQYLADIYANYQFRPAHPGETFGDLMLPAKRWENASFAEFSRDYYTPCDHLGIVPGSMRYRHEIDRLLDFVWRERGIDPERFWISRAVRGFQHATFLAEDGRGETFVFLTSGGRVAGWAFVLNPFAPGDVPIFDWELHPDYRHCQTELIGDLLGRVGHVITPAAASAVGKCDALRAAGAREILSVPCGLFEKR